VHWLIYPFLRARGGLDLVPQVGAFQRIFDRFEPNQLVTLVGVGGGDGGVAKTGAVGKLSGNLVLKNKVDPFFSQRRVPDPGSHGPGIKPGQRAFLGIDVSNGSADVLHRLDLLLAVIGPDQGNIVVLVNLLGFAGRGIKRQRVAFEPEQPVLDRLHLSVKLNGSL